MGLLLVWCCPVILGLRPTHDTFIFQHFIEKTILWEHSNLKTVKHNKWRVSSQNTVNYQRTSLVSHPKVGLVTTLESLPRYRLPIELVAKVTRPKRKRRISAPWLPSMFGPRQENSSRVFQGVSKDFRSVANDIKTEVEQWQQAFNYKLCELPWGVASVWLRACCMCCALYNIWSQPKSWVSSYFF